MKDNFPDQMKGYIPFVNTLKVVMQITQLCAKTNATPDTLTDLIKIALSIDGEEAEEIVDLWIDWGEAIARNAQQQPTKALSYNATEGKYYPVIFKSEVILALVNRDGQSEEDAHEWWDYSYSNGLSGFVVVDDMLSHEQVDEIMEEQEGSDDFSS